MQNKIIQGITMHTGCCWSKTSRLRGLFASNVDVQQFMWYQFWIKGILLYSMFLWK